MKLDKNIPIPPRRHGPGGFDWKAFEVGDSKFFADKPNTLAATANRATGWKFTARTVTEEGHKGIRIWRIE